MIIIIATDDQCCNQDGTSAKVILFYVDGDKRPCENLSQSLLVDI